jgi:hypothetical protein
VLVFAAQNSTDLAPHSVRLQTQRAAGRDSTTSNESLGSGNNMRNDRSNPESGTRITRLGLVTLGFVVGVLVTLLVLFMFNLR